MKLFALPESTLNQALSYLAGRPFAEVTNLIAAIQKAQLVVDGEGKAIEVADEASEAPTAKEETAPEQAPESSQAV